MLEQQEVLKAFPLPEKVFRYAIAIFVPLFALVGLISLLSHDGPRPGVPTAIAAAIFTTTVPIGFAMSRLHLGSIWWANTARLRHAPELFVLYADFGLTGVLATFRSPEFALFGTGLFAVIGAYVAHFLKLRPRIAHVVFSSVVIASFAVLGVRSDNYDLAGAIARGGMALLVANGTVALHNLYTVWIRRSIIVNHVHATTDPLTGIANRRVFQLRMQHTMKTALHGVTLLLIDIDDFKHINDTFGHDHGDEMLKKLAAVLVTAVDEDGIVARLGGDEFAVAIPARCIDVSHLASNLQTRVAKATGLKISIGAAHTENPATRALPALFRAADQSLYIAKQATDFPTVRQPR